MPSDTSLKSSKSSKSNSAKESDKKKNSTPQSSSKGGVSNSPRSSISPEPKSSRNVSVQSLRYDERNGYIMLKDVEGTALDSDEYYEYLYEDLIDAHGATASRLVSKETVKIKFDDERNELCPVCQAKFGDCPHIVGADLNGEKMETGGIKVRVRKKKKDE